MNTPSFFAERLKQLRSEAGLSQPKLAELCGLSVSAVRQFEYGRREPAYGTLVKLARGLGVSLAAFDAPDAAQDERGADETDGKPSEKMKPAGGKQSKRKGG